MPGDLRVLNEVKNTVGEIEKNTVEKIENFHLKFNRYRKWRSRNNNSQPKIMDLDYKLNDIQFGKELPAIDNNRKRIIYYWNRVYSDTFRIIKGKTQWRLIVGLGVSHPAETSMKLHYIYGVPYIPGSALKGAFNHYWVKEQLYPAAQKILQKYMDSKNLKGEKSINKPYSFLETIATIWDFREGIEKNIKGFKKNEKEIVLRLMENEEFSTKVKNYQTIFGTQTQKGCFVFFDAYPLSNDDIKLEEDVMTPHYGQYYNAKEGSEKFPTDTQSPNPIKFVTWKGTFLFVIKSICSKANVELLDSVKNNLIEALSNYGIGAKTAVGYGRFEDLSDFTEKYISDIEREQALKERIEEEKRKQEKEKKEQERLNAMPEKDRIIYQLKKCIEEGTTEDCHNISIEAFNKLDSLSPDERKSIARLLESVWRKEKKWSGTKGKQKNRVKKVREILEER